MFHTRTSCPKTTYANGYSGAWPGWKVSISVLPLTLRREMVEGPEFIGFAVKILFLELITSSSLYSPLTLPAVRWLSFMAHMALGHVPGALSIDGGKAHWHKKDK